MQSNSGKQKIVKAKINKNFGASVDGKRVDKKERKKQYTKRKERKQRHNHKFED
jgi:hypothetical protein